MLRDGPRAAAAPASADAGGGGPSAHLERFEDLVAFAESQNKIEIQIALERMRPLRFGNNELVYAAADTVPPDFPRKLILFLRETRDEDWRVRAEVVQSAPVESLAERRKREETRALDEIKRQPFVAEALKHFPGAEIASVKQPEAEAPGDVVPMPNAEARRQPQPAAPRKKEADQ